MVSQREHIDQVANETGQPVGTVASIVRAHLSVLTESVAAGERVTLTGFGTFRQRQRPTAETPVAEFKPGAALARAVSAGPSGTATRASQGDKSTSKPRKTTSRRAPSKGRTQKGTQGAARGKAATTKKTGRRSGSAQAGSRRSNTRRSSAGGSNTRRPQKRAQSSRSTRPRR